MFFDYDIIILTETSLHEEILDLELGLVDFDVYRCDRSIFSSTKQSGGGVLVAINKKFNSVLVPLRDNSIECVICQVRIKDTSFIVIGGYIPPHSPASKYDDFINCITASCADSVNLSGTPNLLIIGDFNIPNFKWESDEKSSFTSGYHLNPETRQAAWFLSNFCKNYNIFQFNTFPNNKGNYLDLVLSNFCKPSVSIAIDSIFECDSHHHPFEVTINIHAFSTLTPVERTILNFKNANYNIILQKLNSAPDLVVNDLNGSQFEPFINNVHFCLDSIIEEFVPKIRIKNNRFPTWYSKELIEAIIEKKKLHSFYKIYKSAYYYNLFRLKRSLCKSLSQRDALKYAKDSEELVKTDSKKFFNYVKGICNSYSVPQTMTYNNRVAKDHTSIANLFADKFSSVYTKTDLSNTPINFEFLDCFSSLTFSPSEIEKAIDELDEFSGPGPDNIHPAFIKKCSSFFKDFLSKVFNLSIKLGIFPLLWKSCFIKPLFKNGDKTSIDNYRPISKSAIFAKLLDKLVYSKIEHFVYKFIVPQQHGFCKGLSTQTNLCVFLEYVNQSLSSDLPVDVIYTDFKRAFDVVNIDLLVRKLHAYGFHGSLLEWFKSFLSNRTQYVVINGHISKPISVTSGVGQGLHLSSVFFLLFINDIHNVLKFSEFLLFADDAKLFKSIKGTPDTILLQQDLNELLLWCSLNGFSCNVEKCFHMTIGKRTPVEYNYTFNSIPLQKVLLHKDLGVYFDCMLSFQYHIDYTTNKATKRINFIKRYTKKFSNIDSFKSLYYGFIYPILSYCSVIWRPFTMCAIKDLEKPRHTFLRFAAYKVGHPMHFTNHDYSEVSEIFSIPTLYSAFDRNDLIFAYKILSNNIYCPELLNKFNFHIPNRFLRHNNYYFYNLLENNRRHTTVRLSVLSNAYTEWFTFFNNSASLYYIKKKSKDLFIFDSV